MQLPEWRLTLHVHGYTYGHVGNQLSTQYLTLPWVNHPGFAEKERTQEQLGSYNQTGRNKCLAVFST